LDGVGYNWIDELIDYCTQVTEEQLAGAAIEFPYNSPATKEAYFTGLFLISTIHRQLLHKQLENGFQNGKKIWIQVEEQIRHTCKQILKLQNKSCFNPLFLFC
jgi:hypothetical protein